MYVNTTKAADLLGISVSRLRQLLQQRRVKGAYKVGRCWIIPLIEGIPVIEETKRGRSGTWNKVGKIDQITININSHKIRSNIKKTKAEREAAIAVRGKETVYVRELEIPTPCRIVYNPDKPLKCGARVWIEVLDCNLTNLIACQGLLEN